MEAERAAGVIEETIEALMKLYDEPTLLNNVNHSAIWIEHSTRLILGYLPRKLGKTVYDSLFRAGQIAAEGTLVALIRSIPLKYWPVDMTTQESIQEASGGAILAALLKPFRLKREPAYKRATFKQRLHALLIEPIKASVLEKIVLGGARAIQLMMSNVARMLNPRKIADILIKGISTGLNRVQIMQQLRDELGMTRSEAKRTARTEGARVATESNMAAYDELGDSVTGYMIHATPNPDSRYWHKHRSGTAYYKFPKEGQKGLRQMPKPPMEAEDPKERPEGAPQTAWHCLCFLSPLFHALDDLPELPETAQHKIVPDVSIYANWFKQTPEKLKRRAVGSRRFDLVMSMHPDAGYYHFIGGDGQLLSLDVLRAETANETMRRVARVAGYYNSMAAQRARAITTGAV